jgi:transcriptional regulator with XRE-family HTH domain
MKRHPRLGFLHFPECLANSVNRRKFFSPKKFQRRGDVHLMTDTDYGKIVGQIRRDSGMTLVAFGEHCGIHWRTIQNFERGLHTPSINRVEQMFNSLGCNIVLERSGRITSLDQKMEELYPFLSARVVKFLRNSDVVTVGDLTRMTWLDLLRTPNFGRKSLQQVEKLLESGGLALKKYEPGMYGYRRPARFDATTGTDRIMRRMFDV